MKLTIFGLTISSSWGNGHATPYRALLRALHWLGHDVTFFEKDVPYYARHRDFTGASYCNLVLYPSWEEVRRRALAEASESDAVIAASYCPEGANIVGELLELSNPLKIFYDLDTPITFRSFSEHGTAEYLRPKQISGFDLFLSFVGGRAITRLQEEYGARMARPLYGCVDPDEYSRVSPASEFACDLSYMGTYAADRQHKVESLFLDPARWQSQRRFLLAGSMYPREWDWPANVRRIEHVRGRDHPALYSSSSVTLNLTRQEMAEYGYCPSGRFFEAAACGCPILTDGWNGLNTFFEPGHEVVRVDTAAEVINALSIPAHELTHIAALARERTLDEHTGMHRARQLIHYIEEAHLTSLRHNAFHPEAA